ncbi:MAG: DNA polymerase III subunit beta [Pseudomonadota bacterium]
MKTEVKRTILAAALGRVQRLAGRKSAFPVTSHILLSAGKSGLTVRATDLETGFHGEYPAEVETAGKALVPGRSLAEIIRQIQAPSVTLAMDHGDLTVSGGSADFRLTALDPEDFPSIPDMPDGPGLDLSGLTASRLFGQVVFSVNVPPGERRVHIRGVLLEAGPMPGLGSLVRLVNTDGHRLAMAEAEIPGQVAPLAAILPKAALPEFVDLVEGADTARLLVSGHFFFCRVRDEYLVSRTVEGQFPDYRQVLPAPAPGFLVSARALSGALRRVGLFNDRDCRGLSMRLAHGRLSLSVTNPQVGEAREEVPVEYTGPDVETALDTEYLRAAVAPIGEGPAYFQMPDKNNAALVRHADPAGYTAVVMPFNAEG